ncbi:hypothetical protein [Stutzerimonas stutzeri]|uniref:hypothetical protein n=1 Tax=Stutzerimonas stutzeri TaxID=316 RepID=UPI000C9CDD65|nr:hypothetical protein [Stutzerimonas stutzeri]PNG11914.1 hypothetical protein CXK97_19535 [Stutzerimonas stutzeri]
MNRADQVRLSGAKRGFFIWRDMIRRTEQWHGRKSLAYIDVSVCDEWKDFEKFSDWYMNYQGKKQGFHLDKDLLSRGSGIYSPDTCCFLPASINQMLTSRRSDSGDTPGVYRQRDRFLARVRHKGAQRHVGSFSSAEEAYGAYLAKKREILQLEANKFKPDLPAEVFQALMSYDYAKPRHSTQGSSKP